MGTDSVGAALLREAEFRLFDEFVPRIKICIARLDDAALWHRPNSQLVSAGDLVVHLCGNVRQWIGSGLGKLPDDRDRDSEFAEKRQLSKATLLGMLEALECDIRAVLQSVDPDTLLAPRRVQCFEETGVSILVHVVEHFSYHLGQISYITKLHTDTDLGYYAGLPLDQTDA